jgi:DNA-binding transcriptional LysR family regulator
MEGRPIDIVAEGFDAGIRLAEAVPQDMVAVPCGPDSRFIVVGAPAYFERASVPRSPPDLMSHQCIRRRMPGGKLYRWEFEKRGEEMVVDVPGRLTLDNDGLMVEAAVEGLGLAFVSDFWVAEHLAAGNLVKPCWKTGRRHSRDCVSIIRASTYDRGPSRFRRSAA